jgi:hypothetical protein
MTTVTQVAVRTAFEALLATFPAGGDVVTEASPQYAPKAGKPYLSGRLAAYARTPIGIGTPTPEMVAGSYQINVQRPATEGVGPGSAIAARLVHLFDRGTALALATGQVLTVEQASEQPAIFAGDWITIPVVIQYYGTE